MKSSMKRMGLMFAVIAIFWLLVPVTVWGQDRSHIRNAINGWGRCLNVALTSTRGNVAMHGTSVSWAGIPVELGNALQAEVNARNRILDVHITERGSWVMVSSGRVSSNGTPTEFANTITRKSNERNPILAASFNDRGQWIIIAERTWTASDTDLTNWIRSGQNQHGNVVSACFRDDGLVVVFQRGVIGRGTYPAGMWDAARRLGGGVAKFAGNSWFVADRNGNFSFSM